MAAPDFSAVLAFLKALANDSRLMIVGLLRERRRNVQELAATLGLKEPTVSHHLAVLSNVGLVDMEADGNTHWYRLRQDELQRIGRTLFAKGQPVVAVADDDAAPDRRILTNYVKGEALVQIPASRKKRWYVLKWLAEKFDEGRDYPESEVNAIIQRHHWDSATLRRELIGYRMLTRAHGIYRRGVPNDWLPVPN